jgi:hypothetical protein
MRGPFAAVAVLLAVGAGCAGPGAAGPVSWIPDTADAIDRDAVVGLAAGLLLHAQEGRDGLVRSLEERLGPRARRLPEGLAVDPLAPSPVLTLAVDLRALPPCRGRSAGVVVGEPPRVLGCGARAVALLAAFVVVAERHPDVALLVVDAPPATAPPVAWVAGGDDVVRFGDDEVFELAIVDAGTVDLGLRLVGDGDDLDRLVVAVGRALAWRAPPREPRVLRERAAAWPRGPWSVLPGVVPLPPVDRDLVEERCRLRQPPTSSAAALRCHLLPGRAAADIVADLLRVIDDPAILIDVQAIRPASATSWEAPLVRALRATLAATGVSTVPTLQVVPAGSLCAAWRGAGGTCVQGTPLRLHPAARAAVGTPAESVDVAELGRLTARIDAVVRALRAGAGPIGQSTEGS